jgi:ParB family transcriptional regulator, chromosome partitioning protein
MQKKALGRGLSALFEGGSAESQGTRVAEIEIHRIIPNRYQPRRAFDEETLRELTESVRRDGILQPVVVRQGQDGQYELVAGERRWRAAQAAGLLKIPAVIKEATDAELIALALIENIQRQDLNPIEAARAYQRLVQEFRMTQEEVALRVGKDRSSVANLIRLLVLPVELQEEVRTGRLSMGQARALLSLSRSADQIRTARQVIKKALSVRQTERLVKRLQEKRSPKGLNRLQPGMNEGEERLRRHLGTRVKIVPKTKGGNIMIQYCDLSDLDRIIGLILS